MSDPALPNNVDLPRSWSLAIHKIPRDPGVVLVVGGTDSGKTTFSRFLARAGVGSGLDVSYVDADIGQSTVGPPGCIGWASVQKEGRLDERALWFIGAFSPARHLPEVVTGTVALVRRAVRSGSSLVIVDTTGLVRGWMGFQLKTSKAQLLRPRHLVLFTGSRELGPLPYALSTFRGVTVHRLRIPVNVHKRGPDERRAYRAARFKEFFAESQERMFTFPDLFLWGRSWYRPGTPLPDEERVALERRLQISLARAEKWSGFTFAVKAAQVEQRYAEAAPLPRRSGVHLLPLQEWTGRLCAIEREPGDALAVGKLLSVNFQERTVRILGKSFARGRGRILRIGAEIPV